MNTISFTLITPEGRRELTVPSDETLIHVLLQNGVPFRGQSWSESLDRLAVFIGGRSGTVWDLARPPENGSFVEVKERRKRKTGIEVKPTCFSPAFTMTVDVPSDRDEEEYIDEFLEGILSEEARYNCEWDFA